VKQINISFVGRAIRHWAGRGLITGLRQDEIKASGGRVAE
jgi:hypothetical protein